MQDADAGIVVTTQRHVTWSVERMPWGDADGQGYRVEARWLCQNGSTEGTLGETLFATRRAAELAMIRAAVRSARETDDTYSLEYQ